MSVAQILKKHGELGHSVGDMHVGELALEKDGALRCLGAFVVEQIGEVDLSRGRIFLLGRRRWGRLYC